MARLRLHTRNEFASALLAIPMADRLRGDVVFDEPLSDYSLWHVLTRLVNEAIEASQWDTVRPLLDLYDAVERAGPGSEMYASSWVAFLEDVRPVGQKAVARPLAARAPAFSAAIQRDRGMR